MSDAHLEESALLRLVVGDLSPAERQGAERHLWMCDTCRETFRASERLDAALRAAGPALAEVDEDAKLLPADDPFARRPKGRLISPTVRTGTGVLAEAVVHEVREARKLALPLRAALEGDGARHAALAALDLDAIRNRLALAYALDGLLARAEQDATRLGRSAAAALERISREERKPAAKDAERTMPLSDMAGRAHLLSGAASLLTGDFVGAETRLQEAWQAFGEGRASEPLLARTEVLEALRRVVEGRWAEVEALAARAGETFALTGAEADSSRATLASGLAAWGAGRIRPALTLLRKAALGFGRAEAWGGFSIAACAAALCLAADGRVAESRRAFCELRLRKSRRAPLSERLFIRETERIALLLVREPGKKNGATLRFSAGDIVLLRAASILADGIVSAARESDIRLDEALRAPYGNPSRGFAFLYSCQKAALLVAQNPLRALELSRRVYDEALFLIDANLDSRLATPTPREVVQAEAKLLESQAQVQLGNSLESRVAACEARELFKAGGDIGFGTALANYFEGQAAGFSRDYVSGERLLKKALGVFAEFGQDNLMGRAEAALGTLYGQKGDTVRSLPYIEQGIEHLDPVTDIQPLTIVLHNRAHSLARLERLDEARSAYAKALLLARRLASAAHIQTIRISFANLEMRRGSFARALEAFSDLAKQSAAAGNLTDSVFCDLCAAECLGRLGRDEEMAEAILTLRRECKQNQFSPSPAMDELFSCLDQGDLDADLVAHVRIYLQDEANGIHRSYRRLKIVG